MIRRNAAQYTKNQESLKQHSFTAMRGVDATKAPTQPDTVLNTMNLDIDYDGGLILRKPLYISTVYDSSDVYTMYDKSTKVYIIEDTFKIFKDNTEQHISKVVFTDIYGIQYFKELEYLSNFFDFTNCKVTNLTTATLFTNVTAYLDIINESCKIKVYNPNTESNEQPRTLKLYKLDDSWVLEMITPEINVISNSDISVDFNTTLSYPMAIRDNYNSTYTSISGILAYTGNLSKYVENDSFYKYTVVDFEKVYLKDTFPQTLRVNEILDLEIDISKPLDEDPSDPNYLDLHISHKSGDFSSYLIESVTISYYPTKGNVSETQYLYRKNESGLTKIYPQTITIGAQYNNDINNTDGYYVKFKISCKYFSPIGFLTNVTLPKLTESDDVFKLSESVSTNGFNIAVLKAFFNKPVDSTTDYSDDSAFFIKWERSLNGRVWEDAFRQFNIIPIFDNYGNVVDYQQVLNTDTVYHIDIKTNELDETKSWSWKSEQYYWMSSPTQEMLDDPTKAIVFCPDCLIIENTPENARYVYRAVLIKANKGSDYGTPEGLPEGSKEFYCKDITISDVSYYFKTNTPYFSVDLKNPNLGTMLYWKNSLYSISPDFKNTIYASDPDSAIFPVSRIIDLGTFEGNTVTKLIPWRDYLIAFTENTVHLVKEQEVGFTTKVINTFIGAPQRDADTCVATLNGIVFKSGYKLYSITPNVNSGDETIFNVSEISKPIEHILDKFSYNDEYKPFAFTTPEAYYLFVPSKPDEAGNINTFCLKYNYTLRVWTQYKYPVLLYKYEMLNVSDIRVFSRTADGIVEYYFEKEPDDVGELQPYGDFLTTEKDSEQAYKISPIEFFVDSGQKTDNLSLTKQFVESKIIVATLSNKDNFEMDVQIAIEGNTFNKHVDINTDGALVRNSSDQILTLGTTSNLTENEDTFNTMRQVFLRYSGRGKTIRHIIKGSSLYKFKIYETFYRFKILNVKQ